MSIVSLRETARVRETCHSSSVLAAASSSCPALPLVPSNAPLTTELQAHTRERLPVLPSLGWSLLVGRAYGLAVLDGVHLDFNDDVGIEFACRQAADMGFDGKTLIHPKTIVTANRIFAPSPDDLVSARKVIAADAEATAQGKGVVVIDGRLIESLHVQEAHRIEIFAEAIAALEMNTGR
jgi:citrate lyase subunit beta/citryl-CoA lyase